MLDTICNMMLNMIQQLVHGIAVNVQNPLIHNYVEDIPPRIPNDFEFITFAFLIYLQSFYIHHAFDCNGIACTVNVHKWSLMFPTIICKNTVDAFCCSTCYQRTTHYDVHRAIYYDIHHYMHISTLISVVIFIVRVYTVFYLMFNIMCVILLIMLVIMMLTMIYSITSPVTLMIMLLLYSPWCWLILFEGICLVG